MSKMPNGLVLGMIKYSEWNLARMKEGLERVKRTRPGSLTEAAYKSGIEKEKKNIEELKSWIDT